MSRSNHGKRYFDKLGKSHPLYYTWWSKEPKEWRNIYKHRKRRAEWRRCRDRIYNGADLDNMVYPLDSRPWVYYW